MYYPVVMNPSPFPMHEMSLLDFVMNNPEWVAVFTSVLFAFVTSLIIWRQYCAMQEQVVVMQQQKEVMDQQKELMKKQGEASSRHEQRQNRLIQLQHEHEWLMQLNAERKEVLKTGLKLHLCYLYLANFQASDPGRPNNWNDLQNYYYELNARLETMDVAAYKSSSDTWHKALTGYLKVVFEAITIDIEQCKIAVINPPVPRPATSVALMKAETDFNPIGIFIALRRAIQGEFLAFKKKWDDEISNV
jgi:hypothetical protein